MKRFLKPTMMCLWIFICLSVVVFGAEKPRQVLTSNVATDPSPARLVFSDVHNFVHATELIAAGAAAEHTLQAEYLDKASPGLVIFIEKYGLTAAELVDAMAAHPEEYARLPANLSALQDSESVFRDAYAALADVIPDAVFPPTYFLVERFRGIGSGSVEGPLISIEKKTPETIRTDLRATLVHEMVHMEQLAAVGEAYFAIFSGEGRSLLALSIREGAATFFAELVTGGSEHKNKARDFYLAHEREMWSGFKEQMLKPETGEWLWKKPQNPEQPRDLGYAIGARIVEAYYRRADDPLQAARDIVSITDYEAFLEASGYDGNLGSGK